MNSQKVEKYLDRLYLGMPKRRINAFQILWGLMPFATLAAFFAGFVPAAHALTWAFILLDAIFLCAIGLVGIGRLAAIAPNDPTASDKLLFSSRKRSNWLSKFTGATDTLMYLALSLYAGWQVAIVCLVILGITEVLGRVIVKNNKNERLAELEATSERKLEELFVKKAFKGQTPDTNIFRVDI